MSTISITVRDDDIAELQEVTYIQLTEIVETGTSVPGRGAQIGWYIYMYIRVPTSSVNHGKPGK